MTRRIPGKVSRPQHLDALPPICGIDEIAILAGVPRATVDKWRSRGVLLTPDRELKGGPVWLEARVLVWLRSTGRT